jgi:hypothetical protein
MPTMSINGCENRINQPFGAETKAIAASGSLFPLATSSAGASALRQPCVSCGRWARQFRCRLPVLTATGKSALAIGSYRLERPMKRDWDFIRELLKAIEVGCKISSNELMVIANGDGDKLAYHLRMLIEQVDLVSAIDISSDDGFEWIELELTWHGHEFLDSVRDPEIWRVAKEGAAKVGSFSIETLGALAKGFIKTKIEQHTGVLLG